MDLNCDLGEGFGIWRLTDDDALLDVVSSANVACGFHAGDPSTMRKVCSRAVAKGVVIGAQVSYPDLVGFGRRFLDIDSNDLADAVTYQIGALDAIARREGTRVRYVKAHGALYHALGSVPDHGEAVCRAVAELDAELALVCSPASPVVAVAQNHGLRVVTEGFVDRRYRVDGTLVPRTEPGAVISDLDDALLQGLELATRAQVRGEDGVMIEHPVETLCIHGDTPGAVLLAQQMRARLISAGVSIAPFMTMID
jgi:UPF0271 protein